MKLKEHVFGLAMAGTMGISYFICASFFYLWPRLGLQLHGYIAHLVNIDKYAMDFSVTGIGFFMGMTQVLVYSYFMGYLFAYLFNYFSKK